MNIDSIDKNLTNDILQRIAISYPFTFEEVRIGFEFVKSFDATIKLCEAAVDLGMSSIIPLIQVNYSKKEIFKK